MEKNKGIIYYTSSDIEDRIAIPVRESIALSNLPIVSLSLKPLNFGRNFVFPGKKGYVTMIQQIIVALEKIETDYVFFTEHDVLYNKSHFDFTPPTDDIFYYNDNVIRWELGSSIGIRHERMLPLSAMCCNRELALKFYRYRIQNMSEIGFENFENPQAELIRKWGFEPGTKKKKRGGLTDDDFATWHSEQPIIDIRHRGTFSPRKTRLEDFKHQPKNWEEVKVSIDL